MQWYHYLGWVLVGIFILFFGVGILAGIDERQPIIPILVILSLAAGLILVNKYEQRGALPDETHLYTIDCASCRGGHTDWLLLESVSATRNQCGGTAYRTWGK